MEDKEKTEKVFSFSVFCYFEKVYLCSSVVES